MLIADAGRRGQQPVQDNYGYLLIMRLYLTMLSHALNETCLWFLERTVHCYEMFTLCYLCSNL